MSKLLTTLLLVGMILSPTLFALDELKVGGDADKFYPTIFKAWHVLEIFHNSEKGKLVSKFKYQEPLPSFAKIHQQAQRWVADAWCDPVQKNIVVYLRGETSYLWRSNSATVLSEPTAWKFNQLAWLDGVPKTIMPVVASVTDLFDKDDVFAFLPSLKIWKAESFSVDGDKDKFYPIVFRADGWDEGLLEIKIYRPLEKGKLVSKFRCYSNSVGSSAEIHQDSQRWVANSWCEPNGLLVYLKGGNRSYFWRSNRASVLSKSKLGLMDTATTLFDRDDIQVSLVTIQKMFQDTLKNGHLGPKMVRIPAGRFKMGDIHKNNEKPVHAVSVNQFAISRYEVTFAEYDLFAKATGRDKPDDNNWGRGNRPVINVSWNDAVAYTGWLSKQTGGKQYRLPSEAEWEYAARGGTETKYWWGNDIGKNRAACEGCGAKWGWDAEQMTAPVGSFAPNPFGLYDTVGNVGEWVADPWHDNYKDAPSDGRLWKNEGESDKVFRGGSWVDLPEDCRAAVRDSGALDDENYALGFRVAIELR